MTSRNIVTTICPCIHAGTAPAYTGLLMRWAAASAADSVLVITKSVAAKPMSTRTTSFAPQPRNIRSIMPIEPTPSGVSPATCR